MKRFFPVLIGLYLSAMQVSCIQGTTEPITPNTPSTNEVVTGTLTANTTWTADKVYELASKVIVPSGVTLTIEPGTIIKGRAGSGSLATALIVARGGKIMAEGTADKPIIFTSVEDNIKPGELAGTNLTEEDRDKWGGVIILGYAPISAENGDIETQIEGIPAEEEYGRYGGDNPNDNSGVLRYVSIRHGGAEIGAGNEINGLTLGGVGDGTIIDHIEIFATLDDGVEFFGGTVKVTNVITSYTGDDGLDIDQNFAGSVTNFAVFHGGSVSDEGLEIDGPEGTTYTTGLFTLKDGSVTSVGGADGGTPADLKSKAQGTLDNIVFAGYAAGDDLIKVRASYQNDCADVKEDAWLHLTDATSAVPLKIINSSFNGLEVYTKSTAADGTTTCGLHSNAQADAEAAVRPDNSATGADMSVFANWTIAANKGIIN